MIYIVPISLKESGRVGTG